MQRKWYRSVLEKDIDAVNGTSTSNSYGVSLTSCQAWLGRKKAKHD